MYTLTDIYLLTWNQYIHRMKRRIFVLRKFVKRTEKIIFLLVLVYFRFTNISYFLNFPSNEYVRKQHLSTNAYSCVNMKFSYTIAGRKDEICCRIVTKTSDFSLLFRSNFCWQYLTKRWHFHGQLFVENVYVLPISCRKRDQRIKDLFFFSFIVINARSLYLAF